MKGKKIIAGILAVSTVFAMAGCKNSGEIKDESGNEIATLKMYMIGSEKPDTKLVIEELNKHLREKIGAELEWNVMGSGMLQEKMNMIYAANENFDLCFTGYANKLDSAAKNGALLPLDELMEEHTPELKSQIPDYLWKVAKFNGKIYAVPNQQINASIGTVMCFKSDVEKFGLDLSGVEATIDLEPQLEKIKASGTDRMPYRAQGGAITFADKDLPKYEVLGEGVAFQVDDDKVELVNFYETDTYVSGMKNTRRWYEKGYIRNDIASVMDDNSDFYAKNYVFTHQSWRPASANDPKMKGWFPNEEFVYTKVSEPYMTTSMCDSTMLSISRTSKNPIKALKYIELINTDVELFNLLSHGIEGKHWEWTDENKTHIRPIAADLYQPNIAWAYGNQFNSYVIEGNSEDIWEQEKELNLNAKMSKLLGFRLDSTEVTNEATQISTVLAEYAMLEKGYGNWEEHYPKMLEKLEKAGIQKVIDCYQKQVDEFLKNNK